MFTVQGVLVISVGPLMIYGCLRCRISNLCSLCEKGGKMSFKKILPTIVLASVVILAGGAIPGSAARTRAGSLGPSLAPAMYQLGAEVQISTPSSPTDADRHKPAVAHNWNHHEYLVVWHNQWPGNRDIYAQRVSESGKLVGPWFAVSAGTNDRYVSGGAVRHTCCSTRLATSPHGTAGGNRPPARSPVACRLRR